MCNKKNTMMNPFWGVLVIVLVNLMSSKCIKGGEDNGLERYKFPPGALAVNLTLMQGADAKGAVCLDGSLPGYHFHPGYGLGANNWIVTLEGGGWCNDINTCRGHKGTSRGSSKYMEDPIPFLGILSNSPQENPDFFNWNRVKIRYCDGASFSGDNQDMANQLYFRGQRIWSAAIEDFMLEGMRNAEQVLLSGCSAGGLAAILHCDEFRGLFPSTTKVKCLSDAGMFLDVKDAFGGSTIRDFFGGVVSVQGLQNKLSQICTNHLDPTSCFFPQNLIADIKTPMFLLNSAYDSWQVQVSLGRKSSDWVECTKNIANCTPTQVQVIQAFRKQMLDAVNGFSMSKQNGLLINSCSVHCQSEDQVTWLADNKKIAQAVGDWYFDRAEVKEIDCPYPCDKFCHYNNSLPFNTFL